MRASRVLLQLSLVTSACVVPSSEPDHNHASAIVGGVTTTAHAYVVGLCKGSSPFACQSYCTGTLIAPNLVLTARHCVGIGVPSYRPDGSVNCTEAMVRPDPTAKLWITTSPKMTGARWRRSKKIFETSGTTFCGNDVALIVIDANVPADEALPVTPLIDRPLTDHATLSDTVTAVGYGVTSRNGSDFGLRRLRSAAPIKCIPNDSVHPCTPSGGPFFHHDGIPEELTAGEFLVGEAMCNGDSGGPAFDQASFAAGAPLAVGIASRVGRTTQQCTFSVYQRIDPFRDLIVSAAREAAAIGGYSPPLWASD